MRFAVFILLILLGFSAVAAQKSRSKLSALDDPNLDCEGTRKLILAQQKKFGAKYEKYEKMLFPILRRITCVMVSVRSGLLGRSHAESDRSCASK